MKTLPDLSRLSREQKDGIIRMLFPLNEKVRQLTTRMEDRKAHLSKASHKLSKPPLSDGLGKTTRLLHEWFGKNWGGQAGHPGKTLNRVRHADIIVDHPVLRHGPCGASLNAAKVQVQERRQGFDIPLTRYPATEHRTRQLRCACARVHQSAFPEGVGDVVQYGPNVRALAAHLTHGRLLARGAQRATPIPVVWAERLAGLGAGVDRSSQSALAPSGCAYRARTCRWRMPTNPLYGWLPACRGGVRWPAKRSPGMGCRPSVACLPLKRTASCVTASQSRCMMGLLRRANQRCEAVRQEDKSALPARQIQWLGKTCEALWVQADANNPPAAWQDQRRGRVKQSSAFNGISCLREQSELVLRCASDLRVPFTQYLAERALRMSKVKQKISGCCRARKGAQDFCIIRTYHDTLRQQRHNLFEVLRSTFMDCAPLPASR